MDISFLSLIIFIIITLVYYLLPSLGKKKLTISDVQLPDGSFNSDGMAEYYYSNFPRLGLYFLAIVISQFFLNISYLITKCGGDTSKNIGAAALFTFIPWILIFGVLLGVLIIFPGFKSPFSDVVGYFAVSGKANELFSSLLVDTDVQEIINNSNDMSNTDKNSITRSAEAIMKICGNKSVLVNQLNPENFVDVWNLLKPLMKKMSPDELSKKQSELLDIVVLRDNIGEAVWYIYCAILISSIVYYNLATRGCIKDINSIKASHDKYIKDQEDIDNQNKINNSTVYTVSSEVQT